MTLMPLPPNRRRHRHGLKARERGAATLVVVMLLFFVVSLTAAYTARNLIFEQRTSANHYRGSQATEAAEAGIEWATAMLNSGRIDAACVPTTDLTQPTFRQRYLTLAPDTGFIQAPPITGTALPRHAACMFDGTGWRCSCPGDGALVAPAVPAGQGPFPSFAVRFSHLGFFGSNRPGVVRLEVNGCNSFDVPCLTYSNPDFPVSLCRGTLCGLMAMHQGVRAIPVAAVTARESLTGAQQFRVTNADVASGGVTVRFGDASPAPTLVLQGPAGSPTPSPLPDSDLDALDEDTATCTGCMFSSVFGLRPTTYFDQPALLTVDCSAAGACTSAAINQLIAEHPDRPLRLLPAPGGLSFSSAADVIGVPGNPVLMIVSGLLSMSGGATIHGLVYADSASLGPSEVRGALVSSTTVGLTGTATVNYDRAALVQLQNTTGSFMMVPGSWRDFP